ncbi:MAG: hypothetical protein OEX21_09850, partial [Betaproteobacteria bacterium]|nr:hypothetical protein [Betaproteobacteria bacterium]
TQCGGAMAANENTAKSNVCDGHCQYGDASVDNSPSTPDAVDLAGPALRIEPGEAISSVDARPAWRYAPAAAPPPPAILFGVLRI